MRISKKPFGVLPSMACQIETSSWRVEYKQNSFVFKGGNDTTVVVEGEVYYYLDKDDKPIRFAQSDDACGLLKRVYDSVGEDGFSESVEGIYNVAVIDEEGDTVSIFGDAFNRANLFYCVNRKCPVISTQFRDVLSCFDTIEYDPAVLYCLLVLGYPPLKHTPYRGLHRLAISERLLLQNSVHLVKAEVKPLLSKEMGSVDLDRYGDVLENAILSRSSQTENWVEISGGWDSTIILSVLRKYFDAANVRAVVLAVKLSDGRCFNPYEVDKSIKIGKYYDVPVEVVTLDLTNIGLVKTLTDVLKGQHSNFAYDFPLGYQAMADLTKEKGKPSAAVFIGSFADSVHNFGFSQYTSLPYLSYDFRHYSDKLRSYLYSPSFLKKIINGTFEDDFAYKLFKWHYSEVEFVDASSMSRNERVFHYLLSFILSNSRLPFASIAPESIFLSSGKIRFNEWLYENYFNEAVEQTNCQNMYFWLIWLYQHFHLQGAEKGIADASLRGFEKRPRQPFYDLKLVNFMQMMPEDWGRGLEWRPAKYPLKHYGCEKLGIPYKIIESVPHSYINETKESRTIDLWSEIINNSIFTSSTWKEVRSNPNLSRFFDKEWFDIAALNDILQTGRSKSGSILWLRLLLVLSFGFEG